MKRLLMIILSLSMVCTIFAYPAMAADTTSVPLKTSYVTASGQQVSHITFNNTAKTTLDSLTRAKQNMAALGFEQDWIDTLSEEEILDYADIEDAIITTSFFKLRALTDEEQITRQYYEDNNLMDEYIDPREFEVIPESQYINETEIAPLTSKGIDNGYITVTATSVKYSSNPKNYKLSGRYEWTKMPTNRYTDYFAVSHSSGITEYPDTFYSVTKHSFDHYDWVYQNSGSIKKTKNNTKSYVDKIDTEAKGNGKWEHAGPGGYAITHTLHKDFTPSLSHPGTTGIQEVYYGYKGYLAYDIYISNPTQPWGFNTYATLQHQYKTVVTGLSISIPLGGSLSLTPQSSFQNADSAINTSYTP